MPTRLELWVVLHRWHCSCELSESEIKSVKNEKFQQLFKKCSTILKTNLNLNLNLNSIWIWILNANLYEMKTWSKRFHLVKVPSKSNEISLNGYKNAFLLFLDISLSISKPGFQDESLFLLFLATYISCSFHRAATVVVFVKAGYCR